MSTTTTQATAAPLTLGDETWGDRFYRAYRRARHHWGRGMTLDNLASEVSRLKQIADSTIIRYGATDKGEPRNEDSRVNVYLSLVAMGFDPAEFGLTEDNTPGIRVFLASGLLDELHPSRWVPNARVDDDEPVDLPVKTRPTARRSTRAAAKRRSSTCDSETAGGPPNRGNDRRPLAPKPPAVTRRRAA